MSWKRKNKEPKENPLQDKVAGKIAGSMLRMQTLFAMKMNKIKDLKLFLVLFCLVSGGLSIYFFVDALVSTPKQTFKVDPIRMPQHFDKTGNEVIDHVLPADIYEQIQDYKKYMDSTGQLIRQGMLDSMRILEEIYLQQQK